MKYIVILVKGKLVDREVPIIFPEFLTHSVVAKTLIDGNPELRGGVAISAGFLSSMAASQPGACHGKSESLRLKSRGEVDDKLMLMMDYTHGIL